MEKEKKKAPVAKATLFFYKTKRFYRTRKRARHFIAHPYSQHTSQLTQPRACFPSTLHVSARERFDALRWAVSLQCTNAQKSYVSEYVNPKGRTATGLNGQPNFAFSEYGCYTEMWSSVSVTVANSAEKREKQHSPKQPAT